MKKTTIYVKVFQLIICGYFLIKMIVHYFEYSADKTVEFWGLAKVTSTQEYLIVHYSIVIVAILLLYLISKVIYRCFHVIYGTIPKNKIRFMDIMELGSIALLLVGWKVEINLWLFNSTSDGDTLIFSFSYWLLIILSAALTINVAKGTYLVLLKKSKGLA